MYALNNEPTIFSLLVKMTSVYFSHRIDKHTHAEHDDDYYDFGFIQILLFITTQKSLLKIYEYYAYSVRKRVRESERERESAFRKIEKKTKGALMIPVNKFDGRTKKKNINIQNCKQ